MPDAFRLSLSPLLNSSKKVKMISLIKILLWGLVITFSFLPPS